jgi:hypothetical protein
MVDSNKAAVLPAGLPEMPEEIVLAPEKKAINWKRIFFILLGLGIFFLFYAIPSLPDAVDPGGKVFKLPWAGKMALGLFLMAGIWWVFEVLPIGVTAIAIGLFQTLFYIRPAKEALGDFPGPLRVVHLRLRGHRHGVHGFGPDPAHGLQDAGHRGRKTNFILLGSSWWWRP